MAYSRTRGEIVASGGYYVGAKGTETLVIGSGGFVSGQYISLVTSFSTASTSQTVYIISPVAGNIVAAYCASDTANISAAYTLKHGSAGNTAASVTQSTAASVAGFVTAMTLGTVACTAGESLSLNRGVQGTTGLSFVTVVIQRTS